MGCGCNKTVKRATTSRPQPTRSRVVEKLTPKNSTGTKKIRRVLMRY